MSAGALHLTVSRTIVRAEWHRAGEDPWLAETRFATPDDLRDAIARLAAEAPRDRGKQRVRAILEPPLAQVRVLADLPRLGARDLADVVAAQAGQFFRKNGHPLVTDAAWEGPRDRRVVRAAGAEEPWLEAIAAGAKDAGLVLETIAPAGAPDLCLLPAGVRVQRRRAQRVQVRWLAGIAAGLWIVAGAAFIARLVLERRAVERELQALGTPLASVLAARRQLGDAAATVTALRVSKADRGKATAALAAIASVLPDSSVLSSFAWRAGGAGTVSGWARDPGSVMRALVRAGGLSSPRLDGPVVRETVAGHDWQRFTLVFGAAP
ncbi:MAG TPA: hypothetical protein VFD85_15425 [Gemmatimonadales bacterium]|nr:hypothetical protein [Gemmatimonadales bacterium]